MLVLDARAEKSGIGDNGYSSSSGGSSGFKKMSDSSGSSVPDSYANITTLAEVRSIVASVLK